MTTRRKLSLSDPILLTKAIEDVRAWIESVVHDHKLPPEKSLHDVLADGTVLCMLINNLKPNTIKRFHIAPKMVVMKLENAGLFLKACKTPFLVPDNFLIDPQDFTEPSKFVKLVRLLLILMHKSGAIVNEDLRHLGEGEGNSELAGGNLEFSVVPSSGGTIGVEEGNSIFSPGLKPRVITTSRNNTRKETNSVNSPSTNITITTNSENIPNTATTTTITTTTTTTNLSNTLTPPIPIESLGDTIYIQPLNIPNSTLSTISPTVTTTSTTTTSTIATSSKPTRATIRTSMTNSPSFGRSSSFRKSSITTTSSTPPSGSSSQGATPPDMTAALPSPKSSSFAAPLSLGRSRSSLRSILSPKTDLATHLRHFACGEVLTPGDPKYEIARSVHNRMYSNLPHMIVQPRCANDVSSAVKFALNNGLKVSVKSRGYGCSNGTVQTNTLLIDFAKMNGIFVDKKYKTVTVQPGAKFIDIHRAVAPFLVAGPYDGNLGIGTVLGGGFGPLVNSHGLSMDTVISFDVVTATGDLKIATAHENEELFWALKGAGTLSFGIVISYTMEIFEDSPQELFAKNRLWNLDSAGNVLKHWSRLFSEEEFDRRLSSRIQLTKDGLLMENIYLEDPEQGPEACKFFEVPNCRATKSFATSVTFLEWNEERTKPDEGNKYIINSGLLPKLDEDTIDTMTSLTESCPDGGSFRFEIEFLFGAITDISTIYTSFPHRQKSVHVICTAMYRVNDEEWKMWSDTFSETIRSKRTGIPVNYSDPTIPESEFLALYWGENFNLLQEIKVSCDPGNLFTHPQGIRPTTS